MKKSVRPAQRVRRASSPAARYRSTALGQGGHSLSPPALQFVPAPMQRAPGPNAAPSLTDQPAHTTVLDPTPDEDIIIEGEDSAEAVAAGQAHAAVIEREGYTSIEAEIAEKAAYFSGDARDAYLQLIQAAYKSYQAKNPDPASQPAVQDIHAQLENLRTLNQEAKITNEEEDGADRQAIVAEIKKTRTAIKGLGQALPDVPSAQLEALKTDLYFELASVVPYYGQGNNANILPQYTKKDQKNHAFRRTCNLTSLSATLEGLGKSAQDFNGNKELIKLIAGFYTGAFEGKAAPRASKFNTDVTNVFSWRLPDFMQIVYIYWELVNTDFAQEADKALQEKAAMDDAAWEAHKGGLKGKKKEKFNEQHQAATDKLHLDTDHSKETADDIQAQLAAQQSSNPTKVQDMITEAQIKVAPKISGQGSKMFELIAVLFGAKAQSYSNPKSTELSEFGLYHRKQQKDANKYATEEVAPQIASKAGSLAETRLTDQGLTAGQRGYSKKLGLERSHQQELLKYNSDAIKIEAKNRRAAYFEAEKAKAEAAGIPYTKPTRKERKAKLKALKKEIREEINTHLAPIEAQKATIKAEKWAAIREAQHEKNKKKYDAEPRKQAAYEAAPTEAGMDEVYAMEAYQQWVTDEVTKHKAKGHEIIANLYNHFVRFEAFYEGGFIEDDPGSLSRKTNKVPWTEARQKGYFRRYTVIKP